MRECQCGVCPGYYLSAHLCTCSCHPAARRRALEARLAAIESAQVPEDPMDVCEPLESESEAYNREH